MLTKEKKPVTLHHNQGEQMHVIGNQVIVKLNSLATSGDYYVFEVVTPPGVGVPLHVHQYEDELIYVVEGDYEFQIGNESHRMGAGALVHFTRHTPHAFQNVGDKPGRTLWTVIPGTNFEKFFAELGALPANQPPDMAKVGEIFGRYDIEIL